VRKSDIVVLYKTLQSLKELSSNVKFAYGVAKNLKIIDVEISPLIEIEQKSMEIIREFETKRIELAKKYGKPIDEKQYKIDVNDHENYESFMLDLEDLKIEYKSQLEEYENFQDEFKELLNEDVDIQLYKIDEKNLPDSGISADQICVLMDVGILD
jgi:hypothetical protein